MAVTNEAEFKVKLSVENSGGEKLDGTADKAKKAAEGFESLKGKAVALYASTELLRTGFEMISSVIEKVSQAYIGDLKASNDLINSMKYGGTYSQKASKDFDDFAESLSRTTTVSDDMAHTLLASAKNMGLTDSEAKKMTKTAADLAAGGTMPLQQAFSLLAQTYKGNADGLKDLVPELRHTSAEALMMGQGVELTSKRMGGAAEATAGSFENMGTRISNARDKVLSSIGSLVVEVLHLKESAASQLEFWNGLNDKIQESRDTIVNAAEAIRTAFARIDWKGLGDSVVVFASLVGMALAPLAGPILVAIAADLLAIAGTFVLLPVGILLTASAVELLIRNLTNLPGLFSLIGDIFNRVYLNIRAAIENMVMGVLMLFDKLFSSIPGMEQKFSGISDGIKKAMNGLAGDIDNVAARSEFAGKQIGQSFGQLDTGFTGKAIKEAKGFIDNMTAALNTNKKASREAGDTENDQAARTKQIYEEKLRLVKAVYMQTIQQSKQAELEASKIGMSDADQLVTERAAKIMEMTQAMGELKRLGMLSTQEINKGELAINSLADSYEKKIVEAKRLAAIEGNKLFHSINDEERDALKFSYEERNRELDESLKKGVILYEQYEIAKQKLAQKFKEEDTAKFTVIGQFTGGKEGLEGTANAANSVAQSISQGEAGVNAIVGKVGDAFGPAGKAIAGIVQILNQAPAQFKQMVDGFMKGLKDFVPNIMKNIPVFFTEIGKNIGSIVTAIIRGFVENLPAVIKSMEEFLPQVINSLITEVGKMLADPKFWTDVAKSLMSVITDMFFSLPRMLDSLFKGFFTNLFNGNNVKDMVNGLSKQLRDVVTGGASALFKVEDITKAAGLADITKQFEEGAIRASNIFQKIWDALKGAVQKAWQWVLDKVLAPLANLVASAWQWVVDRVITPLASVVQTAFLWVVNNIIEPLKAVGQYIWNGFWAAVSAAWEMIKAIGGHIFDGLWGNVTQFWGDFATIGKNIFNGFWGGIVGIWDEFIKIGGNIAAGLWNKIITFNWGGLVGGGGSGGYSLPKWSTGGLIEPLYASGGMLIPYVPDGTDTVPAMLTPGEFVLNKSAVDRIGIDNVKGLNNGSRELGSSVSLGNITINTTQKVDDDFIRNRLIPKIKDELRKASLKGDFLLSNKALRST